MTDPHWTSYVGMITGIGGSILAIISFKKTSSLKSLDLRMNLRQLKNETEIKISQIESIIEEANKSRIGVASATGITGAMINWNKEIESNRNILYTIVENFSSIPDEICSLSQYDLENQISKIHKLKLKIEVIRDTYTESIRKDDESRIQIRDDVRARTMIKLQE